MNLYKLFESVTIIPHFDLFLLALFCLNTKINLKKNYNLNVHALKFL